jgi:glycerate 2-kinase
LRSTGNVVDRDSPQGINLAASLLADALSIWQAGVDAVRPDRLMGDKVTLDGQRLVVDDTVLDLSGYRRLVVVGAGKASAAMAIALHEQVLERLPPQLSELKLSGWVNCPAGTATRSLPNIHLHEARPAGSNAPTTAAFAGTQRILELVEHTDEQDAVVCLWSGGGSALLVAPIEGLSVEDKQQVASVIAAAGGDIEQLNLVRRAISAVKGGGLARRCRAGMMLSLIISDVPGDPLATIASGPTLLEGEASPAAALQVLDELNISRDPRLARVVAALQQRLDSLDASRLGTSRLSGNDNVEHIILGNNADAVDAAGVRAVELGYRYIMQSARKPEGDVEQVAAAAAAAIVQMLEQPKAPQHNTEANSMQDPHTINCWISGGEPTVKLPLESGRGGRNQQLALSVLNRLASATLGSDKQTAPPSAASDSNQTASANARVVPVGDHPLNRIAFVSGGTDGEDGPTDAAGAAFDQAIWRRSQQLGLHPEEFLRRADAYNFFAPIGGLLHTGPTGTNVCDLRVAVIR